MHISKEHIISTHTQLREIVGDVREPFASKAIAFIDSICKRIIAASPYVLLATRGGDGLLDISPKGDAPGFVDVVSPKTLVLPERPGNGRFDSYENLFADPSLALIFLTPGSNMTLRVAGEGKICCDPALTARYAAWGAAPRFVLLVTVRQAFVHCSKSGIRAGLWSPEKWPNLDGLPTFAEAMSVHCRADCPPL